MERESAESMAWAFHETLVEVLRRLNQAAERQLPTDGVEFLELERAISRSGGMVISIAELSNAVRLLIDNGLVRQEIEPVYSWDRRRVLGERIAITPLGKAYLMRAIEESGRIR